MNNNEIVVWPFSFKNYFGKTVKPLHPSQHMDFFLFFSDPGD
jgi:hypothetical protein